MADPSSGWWKLTFLRRKKSEPKVLYEIPTEYVSNMGHTTVGPNGAAVPSEEAVQDSQLNARLEKIVDQTTAPKGRHVKVSHSGRFKEKKRVRATLAENPELFPGSEAGNENQRAAGK